MTFNWSNPYPSTRSPVFARNCVASSHPLAAQAGLRMLAKGGNAIDAVVAAAAVLPIVEPISNGLGGDNFAILWDGQELHGMNSSGAAPGAWNIDYYQRKHGGKFPERGWDAVTVPGVVAGWVALSRRFGKLPFADLLEPAIDIAERGYGVGVVTATKWARQVPVLAHQPGYAQAFMPHGRAPLPGERFVFKEAADTLRKIALSQGESFYRGETAQRIVRHAQQHGGAMTLQDLAAHQADWVGTLQRSYAGHQVHEIPPNGQGIAALMALGMLEQLDHASMPVDSWQSQHLQIEAMKLAFADTYRWVADARAMTEVRAQDLLSDAYLAERARLIDPQRATHFQHGQLARGGTVYLCAADESGRMVSLIQSNYMGFGSGIVPPGTGVSLQNRGFGFSLDPTHPNRVEGGKRPFHTIIPGFLMKNGKPQMAFGIMGGNMQPQAHMQTLVRLLKHGQQPQAACDAPRWKVATGLSVDCEPTMDRALLEALRQRGHRIESVPDPYMDFGSGQFIWRLSDDPQDGYVAASDARRDGQVAGF